MQLQNQTRTGNTCNQSIACELLHVPQRSADGATALRTSATSSVNATDAEFPQLVRMKLTRFATSRSSSRQAKAGIANSAGVCAVRGVCEPASTIEISETGFGASTTGLPANLGNTRSYPMPSGRWQAAQLSR